ncbi:ABC transporter ATP-binding protein [Consotaella aegiceratis]|uniref:ABC transporter ATP-binding protein n=1 Tax=Consotaella aegiceratis TaxID=3097961 RepID=UPI002F3EE653
MAHLKLTKIKKSFGSVDVLHDIDLDIRSGEFIVFVGPSGCGKSTLLRVIAGLEDITGGTLQIDGQVVNSLTPKARGVAMVFQSYALYPHMTVYENMAFGLKLDRGASKEEVDRRVRQAAAILQIEPYLDRLPKALSGGQRQRVAIGRAITRDPKVFLFDEPLSNLDAALRVATRIEIARLHERMSDTTMIYVTHDQVEAMTLADRIVVLNKGHVEQVGTPMELYNDPDNLFVAQFIGSPSMNILPAKIEPTGAETVVEPEGGNRVVLPISISSGARQAGHLGVRPENLHLVDRGPALFSGTVTLVESLGEVTLVYVDIGRGEEPLVAKLQGEVKLERDTTVALSAEPDALRLFDANGHALRPLGRDDQSLPRPAARSVG